MTRRVRLAAVVLTLLALVPVQALADAPDFAPVDAAARDAVASGEIPGVVVLVGRGDEIVYQRAFGWRAVVPDTEPMTVDTVFDVASLTKPLATTLAVMALVERGAVSLDAPVGRYLKEFRDAREVTIRRLLTHSAGLVAYPPNRTLQGGFPAATRAIARLPLDYPPGTGFQYSDTGFILLGEVVRRVSGEPLDRYVERLLIRPLGLRDTAFRPGTALRARTAPTEFSQGRMLRGEVHDPRARLLGGVAGHAGLFASAGDVARICQMLVDGGTWRDKRILRSETVARMWARAPDGNGKRTLGWDMLSSYAATMLPYFPTGSVGHLGFTGTSVWIDPASRVYLVVLSNRVHPSGGSAARIRELRARLAAAVGAAMFGPGPPPAIDTASDAPVTPSTVTTPISTERVRSGLDVVAEQRFGLLRGHAVGLVTNQTGVDALGRRGIDLIAGAPGVRLHAIFSPEHGITGTVDSDVPHSRDAATGRPIWSLYGRARRPDASMLDGVSVLVFDIQDVGVRYYTYLTTLVYVMEEAARRKVPVIVLDRPDPITGRLVEGPLAEPDLESFTAPHPIPVRTGLTIGEFARMVAAERKIPVSLTVVPVAGWRRAQWFDETGLPWVNPSPNIRSVTQALLYAGIGLLESTNLSVGRGTDTPFEVVGAPWIEPHSLAEALGRRRLPGVRIDPVWFTPHADRYANVACGGVRFTVMDREAFRPVALGLAVAVELRDRYREQWRGENLQMLLVNRATMWTLWRGDPFDRVLGWSEAARAAFLSRRAPFLIY